MAENSNSMLSRRHWRSCSGMAIILAGLCVSNAMAAVTMIGTRVIYSGEQRERILQFTNEGMAPSIVQIWVDDGDPAATLETAQSPFVVTPQIFRTDPQAGQVVRLILTNAASLPQHRESVFHLNFSQVPALRAADQERNRLVLLVKSRLKVFYRPPGLPGSSADIGNQLQYTWSDIGLSVYNPTPYHAVVYAAQLLNDGDVQAISGVGMIAPQTSATWPVKKGARSSANPYVLRVGIINDFGATVYTDHLLP